MRYTWHPHRDDLPELAGSLLEVEKTGIGTYAEGYLIVDNWITLADAREKYGAENVVAASALPVIVEVPR